MGINSNPKRRQASKLDDYRSISPEFIGELVTTGLSSRSELFNRILTSIKNDESLSEQEKIIMVCELLYAPVQEMKDEVIEGASFGVKTNDAVVAVYGATVYPLLRRMRGLVNLSEYVNLDNGVILSGGTSWNSIVPAATISLVDAEERADKADGYENTTEKEERAKQLSQAKKYWNSKMIHDRVEDILEVIPEVFDSLYGKFSVSKKEISDAISDILMSKEPMTATEFHEPQIEELYNYWVIFSSRKAITPELMSEYINKFCERTKLSLSKTQRDSLREYAEGLFMLQPDEIQKKDSRRIMRRVARFCDSDEFKASGRSFNKLEYYYALYWNENKNNGKKVPAFSPSVRNDMTFRRWLEKRIYREKHIDYIAENMTEAELMDLLHKRNSEPNQEETPVDSKTSSPNIYLDKKSTNTRENADETLKILREIIEKKPGIKKLIVISDWQYLLRQVLTTKRAIADAIAKNPSLEKTLGCIEVMGWPADRVPNRIATRFRSGNELVRAGVNELEKIVSYTKDVEEMLYNSDQSKKRKASKLDIYIGQTDQIGNEPGECIPLAQYISELSKQPESDDIEH